MRKKLLMPTLAILLVILAFLGYYWYSSNMMLKEATSTQGFVLVTVSKIEVAGDYAAVYLQNNCSLLTFTTTLSQAISISTRDITTFRPTTHDSLVSVLSRFGISPIMVKITRLEDSTYFSDVVFQQWMRFMILDMRPSDAVALAVRTNTPVYVNERLMKDVC